MKVLHINSTDRGGGAAIAAYRHHEAMRRAGIDSRMLVQSKLGNDSYVLAYQINPVIKFLKLVSRKLFLIFKPYYATWGWNHYGFDFSNDKEVRDADVIILHWINDYTLSIRSIERILKTGKPVYWFMHDMWPITGGCHHALDCEKFKMHCEACPMANNRRGTSKNHDLSWAQFEEKLRRLSPYDNLHFLTPSRWLADRVRESALFGNHSVKVVRNVLDTDVFKPRNKEEARKRLGLPLEKKLILFGADNLKSPYKGWPLLRDALTEPIDGSEAVVYGVVPDGINDQIGIKMHSMGHIGDIDKLVDLYSACDVFVTPSLADNYPNVLIEAMACGLPCVGTNVGGIPEIISNGKTGILTFPNNPELLRCAINTVLTNTDGVFDRSTIRNTIVDTNGYQHHIGMYL